MKKKTDKLTTLKLRPSVYQRIPLRVKKTSHSIGEDILNTYKLQKGLYTKYMNKDQKINKKLDNPIENRQEI